ncbi:MAG: hypothetical protein KF810_12610 [Rhizobiaceae bacterium]|nr:hypothetical protein [Rhizobiaceae bacterium]
MTASRAHILYGTEAPPVVPRLLRAGGLTVEFADGSLRAVSWHGKEAIRAIAYLVRDENWGTYAPDRRSLRIKEDAERFHVSYEAECRSAEGAVLRYKALVEGYADGRLHFDVTAVPEGDFRTNRCGFCILHPILGVAGEWARIEHVDGSVENSRFPAQIDPAQPFKDIREIAHQVEPGVIAICRMDGDAFEMEDQRNWTDASYKTYVRPLALPWPYSLPDGEPMRQTISVRFEGVPTHVTVANDDAIRVSLGEPSGRMPTFGLLVSPEEARNVLEQIDALRVIAPGHLIFHYSPLQGHGLDALRSFSNVLDAFAAEATLEFVLPCVDTPEAELQAVARDVSAAGLNLSSIAVSPAPDLKSTPPGSRWPECPALDRIYRAARAAFPGKTLGGGMFSYFTELNRKRVPADLLDYFTHTTSPLVHAADDRSVMESLEALPFVTRSARAIFGDKEYRIGPSSIGMRHNPYGARLADNVVGNRVTMTADDPRQKGLFAAAWMVGYAAAVSDAGLTHLSLGALTGSSGVIGEEGMRPAFFAAKALASLQGKNLRVATTDRPATLLALAADDRLMVANLSSETIEVLLPEFREAEVLDEREAVEAVASGVLPVLPAGNRMSLGAYGIAIVTMAEPG